MKEEGQAQPPADNGEAGAGADKAATAGGPGSGEGGKSAAAAAAAASQLDAVLCVDAHPTQPLLASGSHQKDGVVRLWEHVGGSTTAA